jgi:hypothetical protein
MPNQLLFHAHTPRQVAQCRFFLLKYLNVYNLKPPAGTAITIYTNQPAPFEGFTNFISGFRMLETTAESPSDKAAALRQALAQQTGNVLYCDTATYPLQPLEPLFADIENGTLYLQAPHRQPGTGSDAAARHDNTAITAAKPLQATSTTWHAAVVGISNQHQGLIDKLPAEVTRAANNRAQDDGFAALFSEAGNLKSAAPYIFGYGGLKEFGILLEAFFAKNEEESIPNQVKAAHHINAATIQQQKEGFRQLPLLKKWLHTITGRRWRIQHYISKL